MDNLWHLHQIGSHSMQSFWHAWQWMQPAFTAALVTGEIALAGVWVSWRQLRYMQRRDEAVDVREGWAETHKLMAIFRFKRKKLNDPNVSYPMSAENAIATEEALHVLKSQLDRMPDSTLAKQIADFLETNHAAEQWRLDAFVKPFDEYAKQAALLARP